MPLSIGIPLRGSMVCENDALRERNALTAGCGNRHAEQGDQQWRGGRQEAETSLVDADPPWRPVRLDA
jgi:hypothetical protein